VTPRLLVLVPTAVALNLAVGRLVAALSLPVYLDTAGTVLAAALAGPAAGVVTGVVSQAIAGLTGGYVWLAFTPIQVLIALLAALVAWRGGFRSAPLALGWGTIVGLLAGAASSTISYFAFKGVTAGGVTAVTTLLRGVGFSLPQAVVLASVATDVLDKALTFLLVGLTLLALPSRLLGRYPWALRALGR
jgi:energy-coupling factor transport system substrate-specific component